MQWSIIEKLLWIVHASEGEGETSIVGVSLCRPIPELNHIIWSYSEPS